jgi:polyhydroxyalkanoate synthesis repressor PhaR
MPTLRIIKKYPNRRLYDTEISSYITLDDIKKLVLEAKEFKVVDARSEEDLTSSTLLQIITEQEGGANPMFTNHILQNIIRYYGNSMQGMMSNYLEHSMDLFMQQQETLQKQMGQTFPSNPMSFLNELTQKNVDLFQTWQDNMGNIFKTFHPGDKAEDDKSK